MGMSVTSKKIKKEIKSYATKTPKSPYSIQSNNAVNKNLRLNCSCNV